jgi:hypothetical protein
MFHYLYKQQTHRFFLKIKEKQKKFIEISNKKNIPLFSIAQSIGNAQSVPPIEIARVVSITFSSFASFEISTGIR